MKSVLGRIAFAIGIAAALGGCSVLPSAGPLANEVWGQEAAEDQLGGFIVVDIDERVTSIFAAQPKPSLKRVFNNVRPPPTLRIGVGDTVGVTIWEAGSGGLFSAAAVSRSFEAGARTATLPPQTVANDGSITIPYAGRLKVTNLTPSEVEAAIVDRLKGKAIEPQAILTITKNRSNAVAVTGEVTNGQLEPLSPYGDRIMDMISMAGGIRAPAYESVIRLTRGRRTASIAFNTVLADPTENIYLHPNDVVTVIREPKTFTAFGASGQQNTFPFGQTTLTLEEALAKAGGLNDLHADAAGVFLLRFEPTELAHELAPNRTLPSQGNLVPVVYRLNLRQANSFFLARAFEMKNKDIIYIANASSETLQKFLRIVLPVISAIKGGTTIAQ